jgi:hypothetical protein
MSRRRVTQFDPVSYSTIIMKVFDVLLSATEQVGSSGKAPDLYVGNGWFEFRLEHRRSYMDFLVVLLSS